MSEPVKTLSPELAEMRLDPGSWIAEVIDALAEVEQKGFSKPLQARLGALAAHSPDLRSEEWRAGSAVLEALAALDRIGRWSNSSHDLVSLTDTLLTAVKDLVEHTAAEVCVWEEEKRCLVVRGRAGDPSFGSAVGFTYHLEEGLSGWMASRREAIFLPDTSKDEGQAHLPLPDPAPASIVGVPLVAGDDIIGTLILSHSQPEAFNPWHLALLQIIGNQAAAAIENLRIYGHLRRERDRIIRAREEARRELARTLHDGLVAQLASLAMGIDHVGALVEREPGSIPAELEALKRLTQGLSDEARVLLFELRPVILETQGLVPALEAYMDQLRRSEGPTYHLDTRGLERRLSSEVEATIFEVIREAVNNARRHAGAQNIAVRVSQQDGAVVASVEDDGRGFDVEAVRSGFDRHGHLGLINMQERAEQIDGHLSFSSKPGAGTLVTVRAVISNDE
ncbi:MAG: GAF domain-containing protein [Anaerolineae bacterium]